MDRTTNRQALLRYSGKEGAARLMRRLDESGYRNVRHLTAGNYTFPVICVNESGEYFGTDTACMAAAASRALMSAEPMSMLNTSVAMTVSPPNTTPMTACLIQ